MKEGQPARPALSPRDPDHCLQQLRICVLVARWHETITSQLETAAVDYLNKQGIRHLRTEKVPGCLELPLAAALCASQASVDGILALGCVLKGETPHFEYVCRASCDGLIRVGLDHRKPLGMGVIMAYSMDQALARSTPNNNKGIEAAAALVDMLIFKDQCNRPMPSSSMEA